MSDAVIVALITGVCAVFGQWLICRKQSAKDAYDRGQRDKKLDDDIKRLSDHVDEHNHYAKLFESTKKEISDLTAEVRLIEQDVRYIKEGKL